MAIRQNQQVKTANTAKILLGGKEVGLLQNVRCNEDYAPEPASGIGDIHVQQHVPTLARYSVSVGALALRTKSLLALGIWPETGDDVLKGNVFDIEVFDKQSGSVTRKYLNCTFASGDVEIQKHAIISNNCQFMALNVSGGGPGLAGAIAV